ncbi:hypothetical protein C1645_813909 [Glomus cerebriforme]|uniref:Uncharacterized protein n=1 Tax=Glomus cerebriforme TaxID=658196 RepID=A0A397TGX7_9GLOM|nr:hypothetical protein C1645_813909 [Glomus cerebriforme]
MTVCFGCSMMINVKEEREELLLMGKEFRSYCTDCEKEELEVTDEILQENEIDEKENSDSEKSGNNTDEENSNKRKRRRIEKEVNNTKRNDKRKRIRIEDEESTEEEEISEKGTEAFEKLLKDLSTSVLEEQLMEEENVEEMTLEKLFIRAEKGSQKLVKYWFDVGKEFRNEINRMKGETNKKEKTIRSNIYDRLEKNLKGQTRNAIQLSITRAENMYKLFERIGGEQKINRIKNTCMNTIIKLKFRKGEIDELIRKVNEIEEERNNIMEE